MKTTKILISVIAYAVIGFMAAMVLFYGAHWIAVVMGHTLIPSTIPEGLRSFMNNPGAAFLVFQFTIVLFAIAVVDALEKGFIGKNKKA